MDQSFRLASCLFVAVLFSRSAPAQGFNVDCGPAGTPPSPAYGAGAGQPGVWNEVTAFTNRFLTHLDGTPSTVQVVSVNQPEGGCDDPATSGDDAALLDDYIEGFFSGASFEVSGLVPGIYDVYAYGYSSCAPGFNGFATGFKNSWDAIQQPIVGSTWTGAHQQGVTFAKIRFVAFDGSLSISVYNGTHDGVSGFQVVPAGTNYSTFCPFVNPAATPVTTCPCGPGSSGRGCASSFNSQGAGLSCSGDAHLSSDTFTLAVQGAAPSMLLFFQGTSPMANPNGALLGDGIRCAGGSVVRLAVKTITSGVGTYPDIGDVPVSIRGFVPASGGLRTYQVAYRDSATFCTSSTFNYSNGAAVYWQP